MSSKGYTVKLLYLTGFIAAISYIVNFALSITNGPKIFSENPNEFMMNFTELSATNGYVSQEHVVVTEDGYLLKMFRIAKGKNCHGKVMNPPVVLMHGCLQSSDVWLDAGPNAGLAYLLPDACYDLWVGNSRGNYYSRDHKILNPDKDAKFWEFSVDEIGYYDIPAMIDFVLDYTNSEKVNYIGFSEGAGAFYIMCSERPGYCGKVNLHIALAPGARIYNIKSILTKTFLKTVQTFRLMLMISGVQELFSRGAFSQKLVSFYCPMFPDPVCGAFVALMDSSHPASISKETSYIMFSRLPAGTSVQNLAKYGQATKRPVFQKFDYGKIKNVQLYNSTAPPEFNLGAVTCPVVIIYGKNDYMVDPVDVHWLAKKLPNVIALFEVNDPHWNHFDFTFSQYIDKLLFPKMNEFLNKYST